MREGGGGGGGFAQQAEPSVLTSPPLFIFLSVQFDKTDGITVSATFYGNFPKHIR